MTGLFILIFKQMLQNYFKIALRNLFRHKVFATINIVGLALSLTACLFISLYVMDELRYDTYHQHAKRIFLLQQFEANSTSGGKFATDCKKFAQVEATVRLKNVNPLITYQQNAHYEPRFFFADSTVFDIFTFPLIKGNPKTVLAEKYAVVISASMAQKYFGNQDPVGQFLVYENKTNLRVTGVMQDLPAYSHLPIDFLANYGIANELVGYDVTNNHWGGSAWTYLMLAPNARPGAVQSQFPAYLAQLKDPNTSVWNLKLIPLLDIYLKTDLVAANRQVYVVIFSAIAGLVLALACFNYVNLTTARATLHAREVGVRKVLGSSFGQLLGRFMSETVLLVSIAVLLGGLVASNQLGWFNALADKQMDWGTLLTPTHLVALLGSLLLLCLLTGLYPALVLSSFKPSTVLKGSIGGPGRSRLRQLLVVGQYTVSVAMIIATLVVQEQLDYIQHKDLGYERSQILTLDLRNAPTNIKENFKQQIKNLSGVEAASLAYGLPGTGQLRGEKLVSEYVPKAAEDASIFCQSIDEDYFKTFDIKLLAGRNLDPRQPADRKAFMINQAALEYFGWQDFKGKMVGYYTFEYQPDGSYREIPQRGDVVGVVADYHHANLKTQVAPMILRLNQGFESQFAVRLGPSKLAATVEQIKSVWVANFPDKPFEYRFMDDTFNQTYTSDVRAGKLFGLFATLAVLLSCLGLFGLATFVAQTRTREIGIRKVLGASVLQITTLLSRDFLKLVLLAFAVASPIAYYAMDKWLADFAYRIGINGWIFVWAGLLTIGVAVLTVGWRSVAAALANPTQSLRSE